MWAVNNFDRLEEFFETANTLGYEKIELNHQISPAMLEGIDLSRYRFSSVHEPCPTTLSTDELKDRDWLISSTDSSNRARGVESIKRSIDLAHQVGATLVVIHCGQIPDPLQRERRLRQLYNAGQKDSPQAVALKAEMLAARAAASRPHLEAVKTSLRELLDYASPLGVRLGLENRDKWMYLPNQDEMAELLAMAGPDQLGMVFDSGHAMSMDRLGFLPFETWLTRFGSRILGCHLHDVIGLTDHLAPGLGEVDFRHIASFLPDAAIRTLELHIKNTPQQVLDGLRRLADAGAVFSL